MKSFLLLAAVAYEAAESGLDSVAITNPEFAEAAAQPRVPFAALEPDAQLVWMYVAEALWKEFEALH
ncbi:MAG: hypothetical protein ACLGJD_12260 [Gammaproteobacteria bacterium]